MTKHDEYIQSQVGPMLQPGEQVLHVAYLRRQPAIIWQIMFVLIAFLLTKAYFGVLTNRRLILIRSKISAFSFSGAPKLVNIGVEEHDVRQIQKCSTGGFANNRSMTFVMQTGKLTLRISPWFKTVSGTKDFFEQVPNLINSGQLQQLAAAPQQGGYAMPPHHSGHAQQQQQQGGYPMQQPQGGHAPMQQGAWGAPPAAPPQGMWNPGSRVLVLAGDGNRYPATIVHSQDGHCLCAMPNGQQHWFPANAVAPA